VAAAETEWATVCLAGFQGAPTVWFRRWLRGRREHEGTEADLILRLRALAALAPGRSLEQALDVAGVSLGELLAAADPNVINHRDMRARARAGREGDREDESD
jgi:hypothetical protein